MEWFFKDRPFLKNMMAVALPVSVQFLISTSINMADTVMISSQGGASIAAVGLVNQFVFFFMVVVFGICSAGAVFFAQYYGSDDIPNVRRFLSITMQLTLLISTIFMVASLIWSEEIMRLLIPDPEVIGIGIGYLQIIALTFIFTGLSQCFNTVLRSVNRAKEPLRVSIIAFFTNVFFNYVFIFGKFGAPALGAKGAAIGTLIARTVEIVLLFYLIYSDRMSRADVRPLELLVFHKNRMKHFFPIALPIMIAETLWSFGQLLFAIAYARIGQDATASIQLTATIQNVFFILVNSFSTAASVLIGQWLGANNKDRAFKDATYFLQMTVLFGLFSSLVLIAFPDVLLKIYSNLDAGIYEMARQLMIIRGIFIPFRFINGMLFVGIYRAGGETKTPLIIEMFTMWMFAIPMSFIGVLWLKWPITWIFTIVSLEELIKVLAIAPRFAKKKWMRNITQQGA